MRKCPETGNKTSIESKGASTSSSSVCAECGECFGIYGPNIRSAFNSHTVEGNSMDSVIVAISINLPLVIIREDDNEEKITEKELIRRARKNFSLNEENPHILIDKPDLYVESEDYPIIVLPMRIPVKAPSVDDAYTELRDATSLNRGNDNIGLIPMSHSPEDHEFSSIEELNASGECNYQFGPKNPL